MDENFLEFWGNFLINVARGKKQVNETASLMQKNLSDVNKAFIEMTKQNTAYTEEFLKSMMKEAMSAFDPAVFQKIHMTEPKESEKYRSTPEKTMQEFHKSFKDYFAVWGIVSREDHLRLVEKYEKLKEKCAEQEETIKHLKMLLNGKNMDQGSMLQSLQNIIENQSDLFQKLMKDFGQYPKKKEFHNASASEVHKKRESHVKGETEKNGTDSNDDGASDVVQTDA